MYSSRPRSILIGLPYNGIGTKCRGSRIGSRLFNYLIWLYQALDRHAEITELTIDGEIAPLIALVTSRHCRSMHDNTLEAFSR